MCKWSHTWQNEREKGKKKRKLKKDWSNLLKCARESPLTQKSKKFSEVYINTHTHTHTPNSSISIYHSRTSENQRQKMLKGT